MKSTGRDIFYLNLGMLFTSTSGVLGRYVTATPELTIFWRAGLAMILLFVLCKIRKIELFQNDKKTYGAFFLAGVLMTVHWVSYFYALQLSSVAIGMLSLFTFPVFTAILEPLILNTSFKRIHLLLGAMMLGGIYLLVPDFDLSGDIVAAVGFGLLSAVAYSLRNIFMKPLVLKHEGSKLMFYQTLVTMLLLIPFLIGTEGGGIDHSEWWAIGFLALFTTVIGHSLFLVSFRKFSVTTASLLSCTQPVFGIILGVIFLREIPGWTTVLGGVLILSAVVTESLLLRSE